MNCKCALECEYKIINLEQHVCRHNVCSLLDVRGPAVTVIWTVGWHWYWQPNEHPTAMHIHKPATGRCSRRTTARIHFMQGGKYCTRYALSTRVHCAVSNSCKNHCPMYTRHVLWKCYETLLRTTVKREKSLRSVWNSFCFYFRLISKIT